MQLTITLEGTDAIVSTELPDDFEVEDFKAYLEVELNIPKDNQILLLDSKTLDISGTLKTLGDLGLKDYDLLVLREKKKVLNSNNNESSIVDNQIEQLRQQFISNPSMQSQLDPQTKSSLQNPELFKQRMLTMMEQKNTLEEERLKLLSNPNDPENQKKLMQLADQQAIEENRLHAYETAPESFTTIHMLYINVEINGYKTKAFVDTGAQATLMSPKLAEKCELSKLIDTRYQGMAMGVGTTKILGKIHSAPLKIGDGYFTCGFTVLDTSMELLLGLDMLRRYQAQIDLKRNVLIIDDVETTFLAEKDCPNQFTPPVPGGNGGLTGEGRGQRLGGNIFEPSPYQPSASNATTSVASATSSSSSASASATANKRPKLPLPVIADPNKVQQLMNMGFDKKRSELALQQTNNNIELAAGLLFD